MMQDDCASREDLMITKFEKIIFWKVILNDDMIATQMKKTVSFLSVIKVRYRIAGRSHDEYEYEYIPDETRDIIMRARSWKYGPVHRKWRISKIRTHHFDDQCVLRENFLWRHTDGIRNYHRIYFDISITYRRQCKYQCWHVFQNSFDWWHWLDFWTGSFLSFWRTSMIRTRLD